MKNIIKVNNFKQRNLSLDLLKIISMLMILTLHYLGKGGALSVDKPIYYLAWFLEIICMIAVNLYVLISGYFLIDSKFNWKKVFKLCKSTWFYSWIFLILAIIFGRNLSIKEILCGAFPILLKVYWFVTVYIFMYMMSPYLNITINNMNKKQHLFLCGLLIVIFSILHLFLPPMGLLNTQGGCSIIWFIVLYFIAGYIKKYVSIKKSKKLLLIYFLNTIVVLLIKCILDFVFTKFSINESYIGRIYDYPSIFILVNSICVFLYFRDIKINNEKISKVISFFSPLTFGVYLIHENIFVAKKLYSGLFNSLKYSNIGVIPFILNWILFILLIFLISSFIEYLRIKIFNFFLKLKK